MDVGLLEVQQVTSGRLKGIYFNILSDEDAEKMSVIVVNSPNEVSDAALGLPTMNASECATCGGKNSRECEGHFGKINFPHTILNPYYMSDIVQILNKICPSCKTLRRRRVKKADSASTQLPQTCKYCSGKSSDGYPRMKFRVSKKEVFSSTAIIVQVDENKLKDDPTRGLAPDYWDIIPKDTAQEQIGLPSIGRVLFPYQVYSILKDVSPKTLEEILKKKNSIFMNSMLVTPNSHRVREFGCHITFDESTAMYKKLVDFRGTPNELSVRVMERYKISKIRSEKVSAFEKMFEKQSPNESASSSSGLRNVKDLLLGKRTDNSFRLVVVGDPRIKVSEIGLPCEIADNVLISDFVCKLNWDKMESCCDFMLYRKGLFSSLSVIRDGQKIRALSKDMLQIGDRISRPLVDGDIVLINRPPSIHQHSLLALSVKVLPIKSVVAINPLICSPLRGDFDGDCLHGYVPQSLNTRVELSELVSLKRQLVDGQNNRNLMSLSQDSLTSAYLILKNSVTLNKAEMQQLQMYCSFKLLSPAIIKSASQDSRWTGKQLFSMLLPDDFEFTYSSDVHIKNGELAMSSAIPFWLRNSNENLYQCLIKHCGDGALDFLNTAQEVFCEWLSKQGLSVSLSDLYLSSDQHSRYNLLCEVRQGLQEAATLSDISLLMVDQYKDFLVENSEEGGNLENIVEEQISVAPYTKPELFRVSVSASKSVFLDMQKLVYKHSSYDNSFMTMLRAGSKGNLQKLVQHSMCLGLQHSLAPLSFSIPRHLSCDSWNDEKQYSDAQRPLYTQDVPSSFIPCSIVRSSFLEGLNPLEAFTHSLTSRDSSFSGHADVSGTLCRKLMFFMRDLLTGYDGTVRNCHGSQVVQFSYNTKDIPGVPSDAVIGGHPVGSLAACAISEAAYSALDLPVSVLEPSPLLALKKVLECGVKRNRNKTASLYLSKGLRRWSNGFEYGALEVKNHLETLFFSEIVSEVRICFSELINGCKEVTPWVCHFYISKECAKKNRLNLRSIIDSLHKNTEIARLKSKKMSLPRLQITGKMCSAADEFKESYLFCISARLSMSYAESDVTILRHMVIPVLLKTAIRGFPEFKKVDILWKDGPNHQKYSWPPSGELYLRVSSSVHCEGKLFWSILVDSCLPIRELIDWERSHPDDILDYSNAFGISTAWQFFCNSLNSSILDAGKTILPEHLIVTANCLTSTGQFIPLNAKGLMNQRKEIGVQSPFSHAFFLNPSDCFVKAAKAGQLDELKGSAEALSWGQGPPIGTGCQFDLIYSGKAHEPEKPTDVYALLSSHIGRPKSNVTDKKIHAKPINLHRLHRKQYENLLERTPSQNFSVLGIKKMSQKLSRILREYPKDHQLSEEDKSAALAALQFHPRWPEKIGSGILEIKVGLHPDYKETCFILRRTDGTEEDFSYHKCIINALEIMSPKMAKAYRSRWNNNGMNQPQEVEG